MNVSTDEAQEALTSIQQVAQQTRQAIALGGGAYYLILWGVIWLVGFLGSQFLEPNAAGMVWAVIAPLGGLLSWVIGTRTSQRIRTPLNTHFAIFSVALLLYGVLWVWLAQPLTINQMGLLASSIAMFGYVALGLLAEPRLAWIGLIVTGLALVGYFALPAYFSLWMAALGGGTLIASGVYALRHWR